jgi:hypothetical protein
MIDEFMARIGVGAAMLTLKLEAGAFPRGGVIEGILTLEGGAVEQRIERLLVKLHEYRQSGKSSYWAQLNEIEIAKDVTIGPHQVQTFLVQLPVPAATHLTTNNAGFHDSTTKVVAEADILWAVNPHTSIHVKIIPEPEILILDTTMAYLGFTSPVQSFVTLPQLFPSQADKLTGKVQKTYTAPSDLQEQITHATLRLYLEESWVRGSLFLNHREHRLADYLKAMVGGDEEEFPIDIPCEHLQDPQDIATAVSILQEILNRALILPDNEKNWLVRASSNPDTGADILLRPAGSKPERHTGE